MTGLDPALPMFALKPATQRLDKTDATYVEIITTNAGMLGLHFPIGHATFYLNGGLTQPGCGWVELSGLLAHLRALDYYIESINRPLFLAVQCKSFESIVNGTCPVINLPILMGGEPGHRR